MSAIAIAVLLLFIGGCWRYAYLRHHQKNGRKLPPGPRGLPIIGNLHMLGTFPNRTFQAFAKNYGPIMHLRLGSIPTMVVSSPEAAELFLKTHGTAFAGRPLGQASDYLAYGSKGLIFSNYGPYWRSVRKFCTLQLLSVTKIDTFAGTRREEVRSLVASMKEAAAVRQVVDVSEKVGQAIENMTCRMLFGRSKDERFELAALIQETLCLVGAFNLADYVPCLAAFDIQGITRRLKATSKNIDKILETIISDHKQGTDQENQQQDSDFIDMMLSLMNKSSSEDDIASPSSSFRIDRENMKAILLDMMTGAIDTTNTAIEWTLTELIRHPNVMKKLQQELKDVIGVGRAVEENDLPKLGYLDLVVKESLRLHPSAPFLVPRECIQDTVVNGYFIPKKSRILINYWAIGHDPSIWSENVEEFIRERFVGRNMNFRGHDCKFIPFGSGRRECPGVLLGLINR